MHAQCQTSEAGYPLLFEEMSHRFFNSLQLVSSMIGMLGGGKLAEGSGDVLATQLQNRIAILAHLHRRLGMPVEPGSDLSSICRAICSDLVTAFGREDVSLSLDLQTTALCPRAAHTLVLILAELITNAVKHARAEKPLRIAVALRFKDDACALRVVSADAVPGEAVRDVERVASPRVATRLAQGVGGLIEARRGPAFEVDVLLPYHDVQ